MSVTESTKSSPVPPVSRTWVMTSSAAPSSDGIGPSVPAVMIGGLSFRSWTSSSAACRSSAVRPPLRAMTVTAAATWPSSNCSIAFSALTDSASPGRKEVDSFSCASSNLPENGPRAITTTSEAARKKYFGIRCAGSVSSFDTGARNYCSSARSSSGSVTGR